MYYHNKKNVLNTIKDSKYIPFRTSMVVPINLGWLFANFEFTCEFL